MSSNDTIDLNNRKIFRDMVGWFDVTVLIDAAKRSIVSALFGSYADRRLMNAALEDISCSKSGTNYRTDFRDTLTTTGKNEIWVDYVSDLGDGFNSTYAIAHLIGMKELPLPNGTTLPRAQVLIMGGDEVYPNPTRNEYKTRMEMPYQYAHPDTEPGVSAEDSKKTHPLLFMIPGNHDWYDGLTLFLAKFCRRDGAKLGNWRLHQTRSYFASRIIIPFDEIFSLISARLYQPNPIEASLARAAKEPKSPDCSILKESAAIICESHRFRFYAVASLPLSDVISEIF